MLYRLESGLEAIRSRRAERNHSSAQSPPTIFGKQLEGPMDGHHPIMPTGLHHYYLHVWLLERHPAGIFSPTNPALECRKGGYSFAEPAPKLVQHQAH
jgi:hypothetical protein